MLDNIWFCAALGLGGLLHTKSSERARCISAEQTLGHPYLITLILRIGNISNTCVYIYICLCLANVFYLRAIAFQKQICKIWLELFFINVSRLLFYFESIFRVPVSVLNWRKNSIMDNSSEECIEHTKTEKKSKLLGIFFSF